MSQRPTEGIFIFIAPSLTLISLRLTVVMLRRNGQRRRQGLARGVFWSLSESQLLVLGRAQTLPQKCAEGSAGPRQGGLGEAPSQRCRRVKDTLAEYEQQRAPLG